MSPPRRARGNARLADLGAYPRNLNPSDLKAYRRLRDWVLNVRDKGRPCALCGHYPPPDGVDHRVPVSECEARGIDAYRDTSNMFAVHHLRACTECRAIATAAGHPEWSGLCNLIKSNGSIERFWAKARAAGIPLGSPVTVTNPADQGERDWDAL